MAMYRDWLFFFPAGLAVCFMIWVLYKFTQQLAGPARAARRAEADPRALRVVRSGSPAAFRAAAHD